LNFRKKNTKNVLGHIKSNNTWRTRCNNKLYTLYDELDIVKVTKTGRLRWLRLLFRRQELDPCRKLSVLKPEGNRRLGKPEVSWLESVERDLKKMGVRNCGRK
jgi:hypothetical protein